MRKIFDRLFFAAPMTLGDNFVCNGIVHYFGDRCEELHFPINPKFKETLTTLYQDYPHIKIVEMTEPLIENIDKYCYENRLSRIKQAELLNIFIKGFRMIPMWDYQYYINFELPFSLRYENFRLPKHVDGSKELKEQLAGGEPYVLVHRYSNDFPDGAPINIEGFRASQGLLPLKTIEITEGITNNLMHFISLIENAEEIHCVPSSIHALVDSMNVKGKLFFHDVREKTAMAVSSQWNNHRWMMVYYEKRL